MLRDNGSGQAPPGTGGGASGGGSPSGGLAAGGLLEGVAELALAPPPPAGGSTIYYMFDPQGSITERLNSAGTVLSHSAYSSYGYSPSYGATGENHTTAFIDPFGYNAKWGYYKDYEHNFYYCQQRYYDRDDGRWLTPDPIGFAGGMNLYAYCGMNPVGSIDPWGLNSQGGGTTLAIGISNAIRNAPPWLRWLAERAGLEASKRAVSELVNMIEGEEATDGTPAPC